MKIEVEKTDKKWIKYFLGTLFSRRMNYCYCSTEKPDTFYFSNVYFDGWLNYSHLPNNIIHRVVCTDLEKLAILKKLFVHADNTGTVVLGAPVLATIIGNDTWSKVEELDSRYVVITKSKKADKEDKIDLVYEYNTNGLYEYIEAVFDKYYLDPETALVTDINISEQKPQTMILQPVEQPFKFNIALLQGVTYPAVTTYMKHAKVTDAYLCARTKPDNNITRVNIVYRDMYFEVISTTPMSLYFNLKPQQQKE